MKSHDTFMARAIDLARASVASDGGPFGAVVVRDGEIVGEGCNRVRVINDPTAHAEVQAIRDACVALGTHSLAGCALYTSCWPCPMCFAAARWARLDAIFYAATEEQAADGGFDDGTIRRELCRGSVPMVRILPERSEEPFDAWRAQEEPQRY
jgi:guanine deaminase